MAAAAQTAVIKPRSGRAEQPWDDQGPEQRHGPSGRLASGQDDQIASNGMAAPGPLGGVHYGARPARRVDHTGVGTHHALQRAVTEAGIDCHLFVVIAVRLVIYVADCCVLRGRSPTRFGWDTRLAANGVRTAVAGSLPAA